MQGRVKMEKDEGKGGRFARTGKRQQKDKILQTEQKVFVMLSFRLLFAVLFFFCVPFSFSQYLFFFEEPHTMCSKQKE